MSYELVLLIFVALMYGLLAGVLLTLAVTRFANPHRGKRRRPEDEC